MQIRPKKSNKIKIIAIIIALLLLVGSVCAYLYVYKPAKTNNSIEATSDSTTTTSGSSTTSSPSETPVKPNNSNTTTKEPTKVENKTPIQYEGEKPGDSATTDNEQFRIPEEE